MPVSKSAREASPSSRYRGRRLRLHHILPEDSEVVIKDDEPTRADQSPTLLVNIFDETFKVIDTRKYIEPTDRVLFPKDKHSHSGKKCASLNSTSKRTLKSLSPSRRVVKPERTSKDANEQQDEDTSPTDSKDSSLMKLARSVAKSIGILPAGKICNSESILTSSAKMQTPEGKACDDKPKTLEGGT